MCLRANVEGTLGKEIIGSRSLPGAVVVGKLCPHTRGGAHFNRNGGPHRSESVVHMVGMCTFADVVDIPTDNYGCAMMGLLA